MNPSNIFTSLLTSDKSDKDIELSDDAYNLIKAFTTVLIGGALSDGHSHRREATFIVESISNYFLVSLSKLNEIVADALGEINSHGVKAVLSACNRLDQNLSLEQKSKLFEMLTGLSMADHVLQEKEVLYLALISRRLHLSDDLI